MSRFPQSTDTRAALPIGTIATGSCYYRVSGIDNPSAIFYSTNPENRWTPLAGSPGVCYMAQSATGAIAETVCRNAAHLDESEMWSTKTELQRLGLFRLQFNQSIQVLDLTVSNLSSYRLDAGILADYDSNSVPPYTFCPAWATHALGLGLGGILYRSRHHIDEPCLALFDLDVELTECHQGILDEEPFLDILESQFNWGIV